MEDEINKSMKAMVLVAQGQPLVMKELPIPQPGPDEVLVRVEACGVCRTDLHVVDGELPEPKLPLIPGHEIVGIVEELGANAGHLHVGQRVGVPWLGSTCGRCKYCLSGRENLCEAAEFTGYTRDGGYAEYCLSKALYTFPMVNRGPAVEAAPWLCAGLIGYRSFNFTRDAEKLGLYGFGAAAHIIIQVAVYEGKKVFAFTRPGDEEKQEFARSLGAVWAGGSDEMPPEPLDAAIIFAPVGKLVPAALKALDKGGMLVLAGIYMSEIPPMPYEILWWERTIQSVANLTRRDGIEFLSLAPKIPIVTEITIYDLEQANEALDDLRMGRIRGAAVLKP